MGESLRSARLDTIVLEKSVWITTTPLLLRRSIAVDAHGRERAFGAPLM
ncbi:Hypothetical protein A7982_11941 [Minicystis rosea]|nr:Hypothetical protein A7982_11941 [Minicystis rosea]